MTTIRSCVLMICLVALTRQVSAQHYDSSYDCPCADGNCPTNTANFGYYQTGWRRWPTSAPASPFARPEATRNLDSLPDAELPDPRFEGDVAPPVRRPETAPSIDDATPQLQLPPQSTVPSLPPFELPPPEPSPTGSMNLPAPTLPQSSTAIVAVPRFHLIAMSQEETPAATLATALAELQVTPTVVPPKDATPKEITPVSWQNPLRGTLPATPKSLQLPQSPKSTTLPKAESALPRRLEVPAVTRPLPARQIATPATPDQSAWASPITQANSEAHRSENPLRASTSANPLRDDGEFGESPFSNPLRAAE